MIQLELKLTPEQIEEIRERYRRDDTHPVDRKVDVAKLLNHTWILEQQLAEANERLADYQLPSEQEKP